MNNVIETLSIPEVQSLPTAVFTDIRPNFVVVITANALFNLLFDFQEAVATNHDLEQPLNLDVSTWFNQALANLPEPFNRKKRNSNTTFQLLPSEFQSWCTDISQT